MIIGICGLIGSGKGTVADLLVDEHNFQKVSFADKLKDSVSTMFDWDIALLEGDTDESRTWREQVDKFWTKETGRTITPRLVLQEFGTECMRNGFYDNIWVSFVKKTILDNPNKSFVIPDVRFINEMSMIKELTGQLWWVRRGQLPPWWSNAVMENKMDISLMGMKSVFAPGEKYENIHASERAWALDNSKFDAIIENNSTLEHLNSRVKDLLVSTSPLPFEESFGN